MVKREMHSGKELFACLSLRACVNTSPLFSLPLFCPSAPDTADPLSSGRSVLATSSLPTWPATPCYLSVSFSVLWWRGHLLSTPKAVPESASWLPGRLLLHFYSVLFFEIKSIYSKIYGFQIHNLVIFFLQHHADRHHNHLIPEHFLPPPQETLTPKTNCLHY